MRKLFVILAVGVTCLVGCAMIADNIKPMQEKTIEDLSNAGGQAAAANGPRIPDEDIPEGIPFTQGTQTSAWSGLGYAVTKGLLKLLNGGIIAFKNKYGTKKV